MKKNLICIIGRSGSGKDTISREISEKLEMPMVVSLTTREKRDNETDGVEHKFVTKETMRNIDRDGIIAYTKIGDVEYCARVQDIDDNGSIYIIDPNGLKYLKDNFSDKFNIITVYIYCDKEIREQRCSIRSDFNTAWKLRNESEDEQFREFEEHRNWDYLVDNSDKYNIDKVIYRIGGFMV